MVEEKKENDARSDLTKNQRSLLERVEALALVYSPNAKEIPQKSWPFWFDAVKGSTLNEISDAISDWSKTQSRMMTPADLYKGLQSKRAIRRDKEAEKTAEELKSQPIPAVVRQQLEAATAAALSAHHSPIDWARRSMIKEAYGFAMPQFQRQAWRSALGLPSDYAFEEFGGIFPIENMPDQRRNIYHDCQGIWIRDYVANHGLKLVYDKQLASKKYSTQPFRFDGAGEPVYLGEGA